MPMPNPNPNPSPNPHPRPVVLVHGTAGNRSTNWQTYGPLLKNNGYCVFALDYGDRATGPIEQPHVRPWSTAMRVPTSAGDLWFKANAPLLRYEASVVQILSRVRPDLVPELVGVEPDRGWMLMRAGGERLREVVAEEICSALREPAEDGVHDGLRRVVAEHVEERDDATHQNGQGGRGRCGWR